MSTFLDIETKTDAPEKLQKIQEVGIPSEQTITAEEFNKIVTAINKLKALLYPLATTNDLNQGLADKLNVDFSNLNPVQLSQIRTLLNAGNTSASHELLECFDTLKTNETNQKIVILADNASTIDTNNYQVQFFDEATQITSITATNILIPNNESIIITVATQNAPIGTYQVKVISGIASNTGNCEIKVGNVTENPIALNWTLLQSGATVPDAFSENSNSISIKPQNNYNFSAVSNAINPNGEDFDLTYQLEGNSLPPSSNKYLNTYFGITQNNTNRLPNTIIGSFDITKRTAYYYYFDRTQKSFINGSVLENLNKKDKNQQIQTRIIKKGSEIILIYYNINTGVYTVNKSTTQPNQVFYLKSACHANYYESRIAISNINIKHI